MTTLIVLGLLVVLVIWVVGIYNGLVTARNAFKNAFAQIDVQLQRRHDLIPNLVEIAKGYIKHERETLEAVIQARNTAVSGLNAAKANPGDPAAMAALGAAEGQLTAGLGRRNPVLAAPHHAPLRPVGAHGRRLARADVIRVPRRHPPAQRAVRGHPDLRGRRTPWRLGRRPSGRPHHAPDATPCIG